MRLEQAVLRGWPGAALVLVGYAALTGWGWYSERFLNDEGLLTYLFAAATSRDFSATFFLQKSRPPLSALYAPFAAVGLDAFLWAHIAVGALGILWLRATAVRLGQRAPNLVALALAMSPLFAGGAVAGVSNTDATTGLCLFAYLLVTKRWQVAACVALGALVWVRSELAVMVVLVGIAVVVPPVSKGLGLPGLTTWRHRAAWLAGLAAFGGGYGLLGVLYHHDVLWWLHYPPALPEAMPGNPFWREHQGTAGVAALVGTAVALSPWLPALALVRWRGLSGLERLGLLFVCAYTSALVVLPAWQIFNFDQSPRYLTPIVPFVALAVGRRIGEWMESGAPKPGACEPRRFESPLLAVAAVLGVAGALHADHPTALLAVALICVALAFARAGRARTAAACMATIAAIGPFAFADGAKIDRFAMAPHLAPMIDRLNEVEHSQTRPIYTNEPLLGVFLRRSGDPRGEHVHFIVQGDQHYELEALANPNNGQREALWAAIGNDLYGKPVLPDDLHPRGVPKDVIFVLTKDSRLELVMPQWLWSKHLLVLHPGYGSFVAELEGGR